MATEAGQHKAGEECRSSQERSSASDRHVPILKKKFASRCRIRVLNDAGQGVPPTILVAALGGHIREAGGNLSHPPKLSVMPPSRFEPHLPEVRTFPTSRQSRLLHSPRLAGELRACSKSLSGGRQPPETHNARGADAPAQDFRDSPFEHMRNCIDSRRAAAVRLPHAGKVLEAKCFEGLLCVHG